MKELVEGRLAIDTDGLDEEIRCEMCRNPMCNDRGCDGNCKYDEELYKKIIQAIDKRVAPLPSVQPEITDEQAIDHLQKSGWMQNHDKQMYEMGLKERLADDSGSYDALLPSAQPEQRWIPCSERMPKCEQEVLICTTQRVWVRGKTGKEIYEEPVITPALYEDGTMLEVNSKWCWEDIDYAGWDEEEDCGIIPEGWWENRHFNPEEVYNNPVDRKVIAWMPLPEPYKGEK